MLLIKNGTIKTMAGPDIPNGQLLIDGGKIIAVGETVDAPADVPVFDAAGCLVTPGFVDGHCHIGMMEETIGWAGNDTNEITDPVTPQMRAIDGFNPFDEAIAEAAAAGVTCAVTGPGSANVIGGTFMAVKLAGKRVDSMVLRHPVAMKIAFGENPRRCYGSDKKMPQTRMGVAALLRQTLYKAKIYDEKWTAYEADPSGERPEFDLGLEALRPVMQKKIPLKAHAHRSDDIFTALRIAKEFGLGLTLDHCTDGSLIADELAKEGRGVLIGPTFGNKSKIELKNKSFKTPADMAAAGIETAIITDAPVIPLCHLPLCAGLAIKSGLPEEEAWRAITINPARITGIADRVGSLEVGKDADIAIFRGNPLTDIDYTTTATIINGEIVYQSE